MFESTPACCLPSFDFIVLLNFMLYNFTCTKFYQIKFCVRINVKKKINEILFYFIIDVGTYIFLKKSSFGIYIKRVYTLNILM